MHYLNDSLLNNKLRAEKEKLEAHFILPVILKIQGFEDVTVYRGSYMSGHLIGNV